jgi:glycosyltransferase involved in cell wall biosynthesis
MCFLLAQKFAARGHHVVHISKRWNGFAPCEWILGVQHIRVAGYETPRNLLWLKLLDGVYTLRAIAAIPKDADVLVSNTFWAPLFIPLFRKARVVVDVARMPKGQLRYYGMAARLRANSTPVANAIYAELSQARYRKVMMVPNPLPYDNPRPINWSQKTKSILFCGRIHPEKGLELLSKTANAMPDGWTISIVGPWKTTEGGGGEAYLQRLKTLFAETNVQFLNPIYDMETLNLLYQKAAIFVYPSVAEKGETFGLAPLEAMAWGAVPVVSDLACFKDFIADGKNGLIFNHRAACAQEDLLDCILRLIHNEALRKTMGVQAQEVNQSHSPVSIADRFLGEFRQLSVQDT